MKQYFRKNLKYSLLGVLTVACTQPQLLPVETPGESNLTVNYIEKPSIRRPLKKEDILVFQRDTLRVIAPKEETGIQIFSFYEVTPPEVNFNFPSHSIVMMHTDENNNVGVANSFCEYWLYTKSGQLVCYCKNTVSGLHPNYKNSFNSNNHLPEFKKKIGYGEYRLVYKNISKQPVRQELLCGLIINQGKDQITTDVLSGETKEFWISIYPSDSEFKLNNNNKWPM